MERGACLACLQASTVVGSDDEGEKGRWGEDRLNDGWTDKRVVPRPFMHPFITTIDSMTETTCVGTWFMGRDGMGCTVMNLGKPIDDLAGIKPFRTNRAPHFSTGPIRYSVREISISFLVAHYQPLSPCPGPTSSTSRTAGINPSTDDQISHPQSHPTSTST